jgi:hypothetical protein
MIVLKHVLAKWVTDTRMERRSAVQVPGLIRLQPGRKSPQLGSKKRKRSLEFRANRPARSGFALKNEQNRQYAMAQHVGGRGSIPEGKENLAEELMQ